MVTDSEPIDRFVCAETAEELQPLVDFCKAGKLFDVSRWIEEGRPVNPPRGGRKRPRSPLEIAIASGFHSLAETLLRGGADYRTHDRFSPLPLALDQRRFDLATLLVDYGLDPKRVDMVHVLTSWDAEIAEYFVERGADVETGMPLATALCDRVFTALRVLKRYRDRFPTFPEQANVALRHHCREGHAKWISLMQWAGADLYARGQAEPGDRDEDETSGLSGLGWAALYGKYEVFDLRQARFKPEQSDALDILKHCCGPGGLEVAARLLRTGLQVNDQPNGGSSVLQEVAARLEWCDVGAMISRFDTPQRSEGIDTYRTREGIAAVHLLVKHGARWVPQDKQEIAHLRRGLAKLKSDYALEFVWIMKKYAACSLADVRSLVGTPAMRKHVAKHWERLHELLQAWPSSDGQASAEEVGQAANPTA